MKIPVIPRHCSDCKKEIVRGKLSRLAYIRKTRCSKCIAKRPRTFTSTNYGGIKAPKKDFDPTERNGTSTPFGY